MRGLRVMAALSAARDFGLEPRAAAEIARSASGVDELIDALARALVEVGAVEIPATPA